LSRSSIRGSVSGGGMESRAKDDVADGCARHFGECGQRGVSECGQGFPGGADGRGVGIGGDSGSCGTPDGLWRSAEQESGGGDALDEMHRSATLGAAPQWLFLTGRSQCGSGGIFR